MNDRPEWRDIAFTALPPGWVNVYENTDGTHLVLPCPGVILREAVRDGGGYEVGDRETVYADSAGYDDGNLIVAAGQSLRTDYRMTTTRENWAEIEGSQRQHAMGAAR